MHRKKILAGFAVAAAAAIATLSLSGSANATSPVSTSVSPSGLVYGCIVPETHTGTPIVDWHGVYKAGDKCGTSHQLVVWTAGTKVPTGPKGDPGKNGTNGTNGKDGKDGTNAQALPYGIALVNVSRGCGDHVGYVQHYDRLTGGRHGFGDIPDELLGCEGTVRHHRPGVLHDRGRHRVSARGYQPRRHERRSGGQL